MSLVVFILIIIVCVVLGLIILIQNPKGGGLSGTLAGFNNQFMGVKQTTDVLEKGTWLFAAILGILCLVSPAFIPKGAAKPSGNDDLFKGVGTPVKSSAQPSKNVPMPGADTSKIKP